MAQNSYISVDDLKARVDERTLAQLGSDTGQDGTVSPTNTIIEAAIEDASSDVETYAMRGGIYSLQDLLDLQTADDGTLKALVASLALGNLMGRRPEGVVSESIRERVRMARQTLEDLRDGRRIFTLDKAVQGGLPSIQILTREQRTLLNMDADSKFFPRRTSSEVF